MVIGDDSAAISRSKARRYRGRVPRGARDRERVRPCAFCFIRIAPLPAKWSFFTSEALVAQLPGPCRVLNATPGSRSGTPSRRPRMPTNAPCLLPTVISAQWTGAAARSPDGYVGANAHGRAIPRRPRVCAGAEWPRWGVYTVVRITLGCTKPYRPQMGSRGGRRRVGRHRWHGGPTRPFLFGAAAATRRPNAFSPYTRLSPLPRE